MITKADWSTFRGTCGAILCALDQQTTLEFPSRELFTPLDFERYLSGLKFESDLRHTLDLTFDALRDFANALAAAHELAAATVTPDPTPDAVAQMIKTLKVISKDLKQDQRFGAIVEVAAAAATAVSNAQ